MMKQSAERLLVFGFVGTLFLVALFFFILPRERFSELENRYLQASPHLTWDNLMSKEYAEEAERFVTDHFPFRDEWLWIKSTVEQFRLQQENNSIYKGKDGYLLEKFLEPDYTKIQQYTDSVNLFVSNQSQVNMTFMLVPTSIGLYPERLPWLAPSYPQKKVNQFFEDQLLNEITFMNGFQFLEPHATDPIYYRTDHHWTTYGAYLAYVAYAEQKGWDPLSKKDFQIQTVSNSFLGSYHTRSQFNGITPDTIEAYIPREPTHTKMYIADTNETITGMYDTSFLAKKDQYSYFLGGVHALMKLTTELESRQIEQDKLLILKDSYAHSLIPFLTRNVPEIHVIDIRYYNGSITEYLTKNEINDVLFLFNTSTLVSDSALLKLNY
ncbi:DHHW family protein [Psychrobacillus sp. FSL H8-0484]|uniref:DHHW family protein n=1 Tax=Psychrobacillus sp. FSL H8-0484 TaxID=2921390 RepID=UPI0030FD10C5